MMNQELTARKRSPIKALYVLLRYVITLLFDGSDKIKTAISACSVIEVQDYCRLFLKKGKELSYCQRLTLCMYDQ